MIMMGGVALCDMGVKNFLLFFEIFNDGNDGLSDGRMDGISQ